MEILELSAFEEFYKKIPNRHPIFFNFFGQSQINLAFAATDFESFYIFIDTLINYQGSI